MTDGRHGEDTKSESVNTGATLFSAGREAGPQDGQEARPQDGGIGPTLTDHAEVDVEAAARSLASLEMGWTASLGITLSQAHAARRVLEYRAEEVVQTRARLDSL